MKNITTILVFLASLPAFAQQQQGDLSIQLSGNYYSQKVTFGNDVIRSRQGNIYVKVGKYFTSNLELGVKPNINFSMVMENKPTASDPVRLKQRFVTNLGFGLYGTYSFLTSDGKLMPYAGAEIGYAPVDKEATINLGPYAGVKYFVTERINIDANLSFLLNLGSTYEQPKGDYKIGPLFTYNIGIGVLLGKLND
jgi:hypothetical protein